MPASDSGSRHHRQRGDSNPCGPSPMDFKSISLAARTHCQWCMQKLWTQQPIEKVCGRAAASLLRDACTAWHTLRSFFPSLVTPVSCSLRLRATPPPTARGFEPLRAEPNGFRVHLLGRSDTLSMVHAKAMNTEAYRKSLRPRGCLPLAPRSHCLAHTEMFLSEPGDPCELQPQTQATPPPTARGFEPLRAEPNGFGVHLLGRSDTLSMVDAKNFGHSSLSQNVAAARLPPSCPALALPGMH